jgi:predicted O-methyltransferase YrrM
MATDERAVRGKTDNYDRTDAYICDTLLSPDPHLEAALASHAKEGLPEISVSPPQGKLLYLYALASKATSILEIGTLGGYSTIWLAKAARANKGRVTTLELEKKHAQVARENLKRAGLLDLVTVFEGDARESLARLVEIEKVWAACLSLRDSNAWAGPSDLVFPGTLTDRHSCLTSSSSTPTKKAGRLLILDRCSRCGPAYPQYLESIMKLVKVGGVIIADNVVRQGRTADPACEDERWVADRLPSHANG